MIGRARLLLRMDALAEAVCAAGLVAFALTSDDRIGSWALPSWVSEPLLWVVAAVFAGTALGLFALADATRRGSFTRLSLIAVLGGVNASLAVVIAVWSIVATGFGGGSRLAFVFVTVVILLLGASQMICVRRTRAEVAGPRTASEVGDVV